MEQYRASGKLKHGVALVTGGDSGIGRAVAVAFAKEGADVAVGYLKEQADAEETQRLVEAEGVRCLLLPGDIGDKAVCEQLIAETVRAFGKLTVLVNNAGEQHPQEQAEAISAEQLERTFRTNVFGLVFLCQAALPHLKPGGAIINTASVTAFKGHPVLMDYAATKGAIAAFTRSLALAVAKENIRVNAVAPGPIWTPLIASTFSQDRIRDFGKNTPLGRPGQPNEVAPAYVFLASSDASYITGQTIHVNGGEIVNA
jgi:NAD(P)-dependent dehydrogenase (short-subunit alcohol dehydrogenase family)